MVRPVSIPKGSAEGLIARLGLQPHPEGGFYREVFRSAIRVTREQGDRRAASTAIYFLLPAGQYSAWHKVGADECWHFVAGDPVELREVDLAAQCHRRIELGALEQGLSPFDVIRAGSWQAARTRGAYSLLICIVAPGFEFADLVLLRASDPAWAAVEELAPGAAELLARDA